MAEEKKPKIDLKARLGKTGLNPAAQPPVAGGGVPAPVPAPSAASSGNAAAFAAPASSPQPQPRTGGGGVPVPPGIPVGPPPAFGGRTPGTPLDPLNPLAAAVSPAYRPAAPAAPAPPPQPQRIEVDELAVQEARKGARKQGLVAGFVMALIFGAVGFFAGGAQETSKGRAASVAHAKSLAGDIGKSREQLKSLADKVEAGKNTLVKDHKFPDTLAKELAGINVDFDGTKLAGVRFSGFSTDTTSGLIEFITQVQQVNDRKNATINLLNKLQKPISEQLSGTEKKTIGFVILTGGKASQDPSGNFFAVLAPLQTPIVVTDPAKITVPAEYAAQVNGAVATAPAYKKGDLTAAPAAMYVLPKSLNSVLPSESAGQVAQLGSQLQRLVSDVRGEGAGQAADPTVVSDAKPGLLERADKLVDQLNKVQ